MSTLEMQRNNFINKRLILKRVVFLSVLIVFDAALDAVLYYCFRFRVFVLVLVFFVNEKVIRHLIRHFSI